MGASGASRRSSPAEPATLSCSRWPARNSPSSSRRTQRHRELLAESRVTSDPSLRAVFTEDAVSVAGDVLAFAALALNQVTGSSIYQGVAAVLIALVMIRVSLRLMSRSHDFLTGAWTGAAGGPQGRDRRHHPATHAGRGGEDAGPYARAPRRDHHRPALGHLRRSGRLWIVARVDIDDGLRGAQVKALAHGIESGMKHESDNVYRVDVVTIGGAQAVSP